MESRNSLHESQEINLAYLLLAQRLVRGNKLEGMYRLGISKEVADILSKLTFAQTTKLAASDAVLCRFRIEDHALLTTLTHEAKGGPNLQQFHASILLGQQAVESLT